MLLVVLHGFEVSTRRTMRVHQAIALIVAVYAAGLRIDDQLGWWLAVWAVAFVAAITLDRHRPPSTATSDRPVRSRPRSLGRGRATPDRGSPGGASFVVACTLGDPARRPGARRSGQPRASRTFDRHRRQLARSARRARWSIRPTRRLGRDARGTRPGRRIPGLLRDARHVRSRRPRRRARDAGPLTRTGVLARPDIHRLRRTHLDRVAGNRPATAGSRTSRSHRRSATRPTRTSNPTS